MRLVLLFTALFAPLQALALSCARWHIEDAYNRAANSDDAYVVALGTLSFDEGQRPVVDYDRQEDTPPETLIKARITGKALQHSQFEGTFKRSLTLSVLCYGPWCANPSSNTQSLVFMKVVDGAYHLETTPCSTMVFQNPSKEQIDRVLQCHTGGNCAPDRP